MKYGFIHGAFDMFSLDDLNAIRQAKGSCGKLVVGVYSDELVKQKTGKTFLFASLEDRMRFVNQLKDVYTVVEISSEEELGAKRSELNKLIQQKLKEKDKETLLKEKNPETSKKYKKGFVQGTFDMPHEGHRSLIAYAASLCEELIVGVNTDKLVQQYKKKTPIYDVHARVEIIGAMKGVSKVVVMSDRNKIAAAQKYGFDTLIMGDDWKGTDIYVNMQERLAPYGVTIKFKSYTQGISSTKLRAQLGKDNNGNDIAK